MNHHITTHLQIIENINNLRNTFMNHEVCSTLTNIITIMNTINSHYTNTINYIVLLRNQYNILVRLNMIVNPGFMYGYIFTIFEQINTLISDINNHINNTNNFNNNNNMIRENIERIQWEVNGLLTDLSNINQTNIVNNIINNQTLMINNINNNNHININNDNINNININNN